jgi:hypothetical protein
LTLCFTNEAWFYLFIRLRQQSKQPRLVSDWFAWDQGYTITWSKAWCVMRYITKSDNRSHTLRWHYQLGTLLWSDSLPLHWTFKWRNCLRILPTGCCCCTHSSCFHDATSRCGRGQNNFKGHLATAAARSYTLWLLSVGSNERRGLETVRTLFLNCRKPSPISSGIVGCLCKRYKTCRCVSTSTWQSFTTFVRWEMYLY